MTKREQIERYIELGFWTPLQPLLPYEPERCVLLPMHISKLIDGVDDVDLARVQASLEKFLDGSFITVGFSANDNCDMKRLDTDPELEIWTFRSLEPEPSIRIFGTFVDLDTFLILHISRRDELDGLNGEQWQDAITFARRSRSSEFGKLEPIDYQTGGKINDYISKNATPPI